MTDDLTRDSRQTDSSQADQGLENKADLEDRGLEAIDEEIAEVRSLMEASFRAEKVAEKPQAGDLSKLPEHLAQEAEVPEHAARSAEPAEPSENLFPKVKAEDMAFIFGNDSDILEELEAECGTGDARGLDALNKACVKNTEGKREQPESGAIEAIELRSDSPALKTVEKKPVSEMTPEELAAHIEAFKAGGKKQGTAASYRAFGAAVSFLATLAAMIILGYVCGQELFARTGSGLAIPGCLVAGTVLGFVFGILVIRPLINERKA